MEKEDLTTNMSKEPINNLMMALSDAQFFILTTVLPSIRDLQFLKQVTEMIEELKKAESNARWLQEKMESDHFLPVSRRAARGIHKSA